MNISNIKNNLSNKYELKDNIIDYQKYYLIKENSVFKFTILKRENDILIKSKKYELKINKDDLSKLTKLKFNTIDKYYDFIINLFDDNKIIIKDIITNKSIKLLLKLDNDNIENNIEIFLVYKNENKNNYNNNNYNQLKDKIHILENEIKILKNEIEKLKKINPKNFKFISAVAKESFAYYGLDNAYNIFKSINNIFYLIFANKNKSIISYDLINNKMRNEIKRAHNEYITNFRHYLDKLNKRDLILSISGVDNNIKIWNVNNWNCLINFQNINKEGVLDSACFLNIKNEIYILTSNLNINGISEKINVYNLNGKKIKEINDSNDNTFFLDSYFDNKCNYIISGNNNSVKSYDYEKNKIYKQYKDGNNRQAHSSVVISDIENIIKLIESSFDGNIRIWNFHSGELLSKIKVGDNKLFGICILNNEYVLVGCEDKTIKVVELKNGIIFHDFNAHLKQVVTLKIINLPKYGECLISQGLDDQIKLWVHNQ